MTGCQPGFMMNKNKLINVINFEYISAILTTFETETNVFGGVIFGLVSDLFLISKLL